MHIFVRDSFALLPKLDPYTRTTRRLKTICNNKKSSDKQSESVDLRP